MPLVETRRLRKEFPVHRGLLRRRVGAVQAVDGVDLTLEKGECLALVGESGSGKTTLARCLIRLIEPSSGEILFRGRDLLALSERDLRRERRQFQIVFQDPYGSLNPRMRIGRILSEPLVVHDLVPRAGRRRRVAELLELVGLPATAADRYPHEFSGGQRQRIGIARALATEPSLLIADEPVSALDVSVQAKIVNLLMRLRRELDLTLLVIAHDLRVVRHLADRVAVMYLGRLVEQAKTSDLFTRPQHPYTVSLLSAVPDVDTSGGRHRVVLAGELPSPADPPSGCAFHPRCPIGQPRCHEQKPSLEEAAPEHLAACFYPGQPIRPGDGAN